jgi:hypothetical protein
MLEPFVTPGDETPLASLVERRGPIILATGKEALRLPLLPGNAVTQAAFLPGGRLLAATMADTTVLTWDLTSTERPGTARW